MLRDDFSLIFKKRGKPPKNSLEAREESKDAGRGSDGLPKMQPKAQRAKLEDDDDDYSEMEVPIRREQRQNQPAN